MGTDPEGKVLGILGMGGIGKAVAKRMLGFDMKIQYHNRSRLDAEGKGICKVFEIYVAYIPLVVENQFNATYVDFETLLRTSDILFVSVPLSKATYHLLDTPQFSMMKKGAILVNTARGAVIRESALVRALESGKLLAVGLDVFEEVYKYIYIPFSETENNGLSYLYIGTRGSSWSIDSSSCRSVAAHRHVHC